MGIRRAWAGIALTSSLLLAGCGGELLEDYDSAAETVESAPSESPSPSVEPSEPPAPSPKPRARRTKDTKDQPQKAAPAQAPDITVPDLKMPPVFDQPVLGGDISWPQCPKGMGIPEKRTLGMPMPLPEAKYVIIGLTNGPGFTPNPCLADQVDWVRTRTLMAAGYAVSSYPTPEQLQEYGGKGPFDAGTDVGRLRNVGYQQALFTIAQMKAAKLVTPIVWIDVEPVPSFEWSSDKAANAAVVQGVARGYTDNGYDIGVYSTPALYEGVVGDLSLGGIPEWRAAGQTSQTEALARCGKDWSIQGGEGVMGQWVQYSRDLNITCPGVERQMFRFFHQY
jgi:hypothetical protein